MVMWGLSMSVAPFVGQNWGARFPDRVSRAIRLSNLFSLSWGVFAYLVLISIGPYLVGQVSDDQKVADAARHYLLIAPLAIGLMGVTMNCVSSFNALGKPSPPLAISLTQMFAFSIPFALLGDYLFGYRGIFVGIIISALFTALIAYGWLRLHLRLN
jgi:Na+-driven multidrug efflux pump